MATSSEGLANSIVHMATSSEGLANSILTDLEVLEQIRIEEADFYGSSLIEEEENFQCTDDGSDRDEVISLSDDDSSTRHEVNQMTVPSKSSLPDNTLMVDEEEAKIAAEFDKGCGCCDRCYQFSVSEVKDFRLNIMEFSKTERDMFLLGKLQLLIRDSSTVSHARSFKPAKKRRLTATYAFDHRIVCQKAFCFLHCLGEFTLCSLKNHLMEIGPVPREHGSKGHKAYNAYPFDVVADAITFIKNYSTVFGLPQPAAPRGRANQAPTYLPAHQNHKIVHKGCMYRERKTFHAISKFY